jgi:hypothetical protein
MATLAEISARAVLVVAVQWSTRGRERGTQTYSSNARHPAMLAHLCAQSAAVVLTVSSRHPLELAPHGVSPDPSGLLQNPAECSTHPAGQDDGGDASACTPSRSIAMCMATTLMASWPPCVCIWATVCTDHSVISSIAAPTEASFDSATSSC